MPPSGESAGTGRGCLGAGLAVAGVLLLLAATALVVLGYTQRGEKINPAWANAMWRNAPAERLFPKNIAMHYEPGTASGGRLASWYRVGIAPDTSCRAGLSEKAIDLATEAGCVAAPRATYVDATGNMVATVALVALKPGGAENENGETPAAVLDSRLAEVRYDFGLVNAQPRDHAGGGTGRAARHRATAAE
ncbi:MAG: hypothetical protein GEV11_05265 [Streptosporangiales bacterium]|nr:hypothetical protein [Streptosporangiales bacterium]